MREREREREREMGRVCMCVSLVPRLPDLGDEVYVCMCICVWLLG